MSFAINKPIDDDPAFADNFVFSIESHRYSAAIHPRTIVGKTFPSTDMRPHPVVKNPDFVLIGGLGFLQLVRWVVVLLTR